MFDEGSVFDHHIEHDSGDRARGRPRGIDIRRFRPNIVLDAKSTEPFAEDAWVGRVLEFGDGNGPSIHLTMRDQRCVMINLDLDTAETDPEFMKTVVRLNENHAGVYGAVIRPGELRVGQLARLKE